MLRYIYTLFLIITVPLLILTGCSKPVEIFAPSNSNVHVMTKKLAIERPDQDTQHYFVIKEGATPETTVVEIGRQVVPPHIPAYPAEHSAKAAAPRAAETERVNRTDLLPPPLYSSQSSRNTSNAMGQQQGFNGSQQPAFGAPVINNSYQYYHQPQFMPPAYGMQQGFAPQQGMGMPGPYGPPAMGMGAPFAPPHPYGSPMMPHQALPYAGQPVPIMPVQPVPFSVQ